MPRCTCPRRCDAPWSERVSDPDQSSVDPLGTTLRSEVPSDGSDQVGFITTKTNRSAQHPRLAAKQVMRISGLLRTNNLSCIPYASTVTTCTVGKSLFGSSLRARQVDGDRKGRLTQRMIDIQPAHLAERVMLGVCRVVREVGR